MNNQRINQRFATQALVKRHLGTRRECSISKPFSHLRCFEHAFSLSQNNVVGGYS
jgi:hypothetical protein